MKLAIALIISFFSYCYLNAQNLTESEIFKISFTSTESLEKYDTESDLVLGFENDNYAVDIEIVPIAEESEKFINDQKYGSKEIAEDMGFESIVDGGTIPYVKDAYYVLTEESEEDQLIPVYIMAMVNHELRIAYEITVYCYNLNSTEGEKIIKSFRIKSN